MTLSEGNEECDNEPERRFYHDLTSGFCKPFTYTGCGGNPNNFESYYDCINFCGQFEGKVAVAEMKGESTGSGSIVLSQADPASKLVIRGSLKGLTEGSYKVMFHEIGKGQQGCEIASEKVKAIFQLLKPDA